MARRGLEVGGQRLGEKGGLETGEGQGPTLETMLSLGLIQESQDLRLHQIRPLKDTLPQHCHTERHASIM